MGWTIETAATAAMLALGGCANAPTASAPAAERAYAVSGFTGVELAGPDDVRVTVGPAFSVRAAGPSDVLDRLDVAVQGDRLRVRRTGRSVGRQGASVFVTLPVLRSASLGGSGDLNVDRVEGGELSAAVGGSGDLTVGRLAVDRMMGSVAGSGTLSLAGTARDLELSVAGSGGVAAGDLVAERATVSVMGSGDVRATVRGSATVSVIGSGDVDLGPAARCQVAKAGSGSVRCGG